MDRQFPFFFISPMPFSPRKTLIPSPAGTTLPGQMLEPQALGHRPLTWLPAARPRLTSPGTLDTSPVLPLLGCLPAAAQGSPHTKTLALQTDAGESSLD